MMRGVLDHVHVVQNQEEIIGMVDHVHVQVIVLVVSMQVVETHSTQEGVKCLRNANHVFKNLLNVVIVMVDRQYVP